MKIPPLSPAGWPRATPLRALARAGAACAAIALLCAFESYKYPLQDLWRNRKTQAEVKKAMGSGDTSLYGDHYLITRDCLKESGLRPEFVERIALKTSDIDYDNFAQEASHYKAENHCDRAHGVSTAEALRTCLAYYRARVAEAWNTASIGSEPKEENFVKALPRALHALEDFFSHSNYITLPTAEQDTLGSCWTSFGATSVGSHDDLYRAIELDDRCFSSTGSSPLPSSLLLTGFDPKLGKAKYRPLGDAYSHAEFAMDGPTYPPGEEAYRRARAAAAKACVAAIADFKRVCRLDDMCRARFEVFFAK